MENDCCKVASLYSNDSLCRLIWLTFNDLCKLQPASTCSSGLTPHTNNIHYKFTEYREIQMSSCCKWHLCSFKVVWYCISTAVNSGSVSEWTTYSSTNLNVTSSSFVTCIWYIFCQNRLQQLLASRNLFYINISLFRRKKHYKIQTRCFISILTI